MEYDYSKVKKAVENCLHDKLNAGFVGRKLFGYDDVIVRSIRALYVHRDSWVFNWETMRYCDPDAYYMDRYGTPRMQWIIREMLCDITREVLGSDWRYYFYEKTDYCLYLARAIMEVFGNFLSKEV